MMKPIQIVKILILVLIHEASQTFFLGLQLDRPTANALSIFTVGQALYFLIPTGTSARKYTFILGGISLWYWLVMKPIANALEIKIDFWAFPICFIHLIAPALLWKIQKKKNATKNINVND